MQVAERHFESFLNIDLFFSRHGDKYRVHVIDAPGGEASALFALPFSTDDILRLTQTILIRPHVEREDSETTAKPPDYLEFGSWLFNTVFCDEIRSVFVASQREAEIAGLALRIRLRFSGNGMALSLLPWEALYDPEKHHFLALSELHSILRYLDLPRPRPTLIVQPPLSILVVLANPSDCSLLDTEQEWRAINVALSSLIGDGKVLLEELASPTLDALRQRLLGEPVHVLHFVGHGFYDQNQNEGLLLFEDESGLRRTVSGSTLGVLLHNHSSLRLVYLNACEGAITDQGNVFSGVAQRLVQQGIPAALAMQSEISDEAAIKMARTFYTALSTGRSLDSALTHARVALATCESDEWVSPVLFSRSPDIRLFDIVDVLPTPDCPYPGMRPFTEAQANLFHGRDKEIDEAVNRLAQHPFLTVVGPSGSGKSSLVYAGILPALRRSHRFGPDEWAIYTMRPSDCRTLDGEANPLESLARLLEKDPVDLHDFPFEQKTLIVVDQFEETFTLADAGAANRFCEALVSLIGRPNLYLLVAVRADFYPEMLSMGSFWDVVKVSRLELTPLSDDELWAAIVQPAAEVGVTVDDALAVNLIDDASDQAGVLPFVQETLVLLWDKVEQRQLKLNVYRHLANEGQTGLQIAIDRWANHVYNNLLPAEARPLARRIFLRLIQFGCGRSDTRRQQSVDELRSSDDDPTLFGDTLAVLTENRLLTMSGASVEKSEFNPVSGSARQVDISHEALITGWGMLRNWIEEQRDAETTRRRLEEKADEWIRLGKGEGGLLDQYELYEANAWIETVGKCELGASDDLLALIRTSQQVIHERLDAEKAAQRRELEQEHQLAEEQRQRAEEQAIRARESAQAAVRQRRLSVMLGAVAVVAIISTILTAIFTYSYWGIQRPELEWVYVPEGTFLMGTSDSDIDIVETELRNHYEVANWSPDLGNEQPQHPVYLDGFWISKFEIAINQYQLCVQKSRCPPPQDLSLLELDDEQKAQPVTDIGWQAAKEFCTWYLQGDLPTEAQWEKAARGPGEKPPQYPWGNDINPQKANVDNREDGPKPVGSYPYVESKDNYYGIADMSGNVWEWVSDWYREDYYEESPSRNPSGPLDASEGRIIRGGSYLNNWNMARSTYRAIVLDPSYSSRDIGFRCVRTAQNAE